MRRTVLPSAIVAALVCPLCAHAAILYEVIDLGTLGGWESEALSINGTGQIVGWARMEDGLPRATLFDPTGAGQNVHVATPFGSRSNDAKSINDAGQIVGYAIDGHGRMHATLYDPTGAGQSTDLGTLGGKYSEAWSINNAGQIVGAADDPQDDYRATLFDGTGAGNNIDLGTVEGQVSWAFSINNIGQIVGWTKDSEYGGHATLFDPTGAGNNINLGTLGGDTSSAYSINDAGQIVGIAYNARGVRRATLFDPTGAGQNVNLGTLGGDDSYGHSVNDAGQIVGSAEDNSGNWLATLFDASGAGNNIDLNTLVDPAAGWILYRATDINNSGWIVGKGVNPDGEHHAFLLVPKYDGGSGTAEDPFQIATAADLIRLGETPEDYDKHFKLVADIDLSGYLHNRAVISPDNVDSGLQHEGIPFTGVLDGNGHVISNLTIEGHSFLGLFGYLDGDAIVSNLRIEAAYVNGVSDFVGSLAGFSYGNILGCCCSGKASGNDDVGGLVGNSSIGSNITNCYSTITVNGNQRVGGLVGCTKGSVTMCYSTGMVIGEGQNTGGLVGERHPSYGIVTDCFWDTQTSGQTTSPGGTGKTTPEMQTPGTFLQAGWDLVGETVNGPNDIWTICQSVYYPRLAWEPNCLPCCHKDYVEWVSVGSPTCWCGQTQCHGDADGGKQGSDKAGYHHVGTNDLNVLISAWMVKEPPHGPGIASAPDGICADFNHKAQGSDKTGLMRVGTDDLNVLIANWLKKEPPQGAGIPPDCLDCP